MLKCRSRGRRVRLLNQGDDMKTVTLKTFIHRSQYGETYHTNSCDMSEYGDLLVAVHEFEFEIPDTFNPIAAEVANLRKKLDAVNKDHCDKVIAIEGRIANLLCIENGTTPAPDFSE